MQKQLAQGSRITQGVKGHWGLLLKWSPHQTESICFLMCVWMEPTVRNGGHTHLDTREKASAHMAGHGTSLIITCSLAALKCARVTFSSTEVRVATSPLLVLGSPPAVSKMWPPCTTSSSTCVLHFLCRERGGSQRESDVVMDDKRWKQQLRKMKINNRALLHAPCCWGIEAIKILPLCPPVLQCCSEGDIEERPAGRAPLLQAGVAEKMEREKGVWISRSRSHFTQLRKWILISEHGQYFLRRLRLQSQTESGFMYLKVATVRVRFRSQYWR